MNAELPDDIHAEVERLGSTGNDLANDGNYLEAVKHFERAVSLLPAPVEMWTAATWLFTAIGDSYYLAGDLDRALVALNRALLCPEALDNPFVWLRLGQVHYDLGDLRPADDCLASAYMLGGNEIFDSEDPKYANYILAKLKRPQTPK